ncbi:MAG TPA: MDR family MFS transporter [Acidimicrobiales bacterium]|nr:MDR family MFS transporter [Acidimicrobiales bacterium]
MTDTDVASPPAGPVDPSSITPPGDGKMSHRQILVVFSGLMLGLLLAALDQTIVGTALPTIVGDFHGLNQYTWVVTAYLLTSTATAPLYGKVSDLYGRKHIFQFAIAIFLVGSALSGLSQNMNELIAFRAIQGLGAGGLMVLAITIIGDIVPPRDRGRYQGYFGAVFGLSSVAGPLIGGWFVENASWRWIFYVNLPIGLIALVVTSITLRDFAVRKQHKVDYVGSGLLVAGISGLLLVTTLGGSPQGYAWASPQIIGLIAVSLLLLAVFGWWETKMATEPIVPLRLFKLKVFSISNTIGFIVGFTMFGAVIYLPFYLQIVRGVSPTVSGLLLLPLMAGVFTASIGSGQIVSRIGRYKIFPIIGTALMTIGMWTFSLLGLHTSSLVAALYMVIVGFGLGLVMQVLVLAVQNGVEYRDLGSATSLATFFRSMGGAFGTAIAGAILTARLYPNLAKALPTVTRADQAALAQYAKANHLAVAHQFSYSGFLTGISHLITGSPAMLKQLPPFVHHAAQVAFVNAIDLIFLAAVPLVAVAFAFSWLLPEIRLRKTVDTTKLQVEGAEAMAQGLDQADGATDGPVIETPAGVGAPATA